MNLVMCPVNRVDMFDDDKLSYYERFVLNISCRKNDSSSSWIFLEIFSSIDLTLSLDFQ